MKTFYDNDERRKAAIKQLEEYGFTNEQARAVVMIIYEILIDERWRRHEFYMKLTNRLMWFILALVYAGVFFEIGTHFK